MNIFKTYGIFVLVIVASVLVDLASKRIVFEQLGAVAGKEAPSPYQRVCEGLWILPSYRPVVVIPHCFNLTVAFNLGAVWGSFHGRPVLLMVFSVIAIIFIFYLLWKSHWEIGYQACLGLIMAGAIGNLWDRCWFGGVRDFLDFYAGRAHWPTFNFADIWICLGIAGYIWLEWQHEKKAELARQAKRAT